jgi:hypothetical protein
MSDMILPAEPQLYSMGTFVPTSFDVQTIGREFNQFLVSRGYREHNYSNPDASIPHIINIRQPAECAGAAFFYWRSTEWHEDCSIGRSMICWSNTKPTAFRRDTTEEIVFPPGSVVWSAKGISHRGPRNVTIEDNRWFIRLWDPYVQ